MTPIFKNTEVSLKDVGQHMQEYAKEHKIKDIPRRLLIGSYFAKKIGLSTPLLKWYLNHGLVIKHIYTVVKYIPNAALNSFMTQVAQARLDGDRDNDKALIAETMKLIGNSSYGKLFTNKEKHHNIVYVNESEIGTEIIDEHFYNLTELPDCYYEVEKTNRKLTSIYLFISVSLFSTTPNSECSNFITIFWITIYHVKTLRSSSWTRTATISGLLEKMWKI